MSVKAIVLAAGQGTRMKTDLPKVVHEAAGKPLVLWMLDILAGAGVDEATVVVGHGAGQVRRLLPEAVRTAVQSEQLGTAHALQTGLGAVALEPGDVVVVVPGDMPLIRSETVRSLLAAHEGERAAATLLTVEAEDPTGYGRVLRDDVGRVTAIVEEGDATPDERAVTEVGTSVYVFDGDRLPGALSGVGRDNEQSEYYLTDVVGVLAAAGERVVALQAEPEEGRGVNSHDQLAAVAARLRRRINQEWQARGVWMLDPDRVYIDAAVQLAPGARLYPNVYLEGETRIDPGAEIGPDVYARDSTVGSHARVWYAVLRGAEVGADVEVGPYVSLRPGAVLAEGSKAGTFVEIKGSTVGRGSKVPHLSYIGDATIGEGSNIGAGTITVNYDGFRKHKTVIGDGVRIGSDTMLVAPVEVGDEAYTGAGSVITQDVAPGALAVERSQQKEIPGYAAKRKKRAEEGQ